MTRASDSAQTSKLVFHSVSGKMGQSGRCGLAAPIAGKKTWREGERGRDKGGERTEKKGRE
jgi:hypothetical protein